MLTRLGKRRLLARFLYENRTTLGTGGDWIVSSLLNRRGKRFIRPNLSTTDFFKLLKHRNVRYVVLRWFEQLPYVQPGHDIDMLIADDGVPLVDDLLTFWPVGQAIDVYSETGAPGYMYSPWFLKPGISHEIALFPPHLARRILDNALCKDDLFHVPNEQDHFFSLAYHAIYLKGIHSGLRSIKDESNAVSHSSHDYATVLSELAKRIGLALPAAPRIEHIDDILAQHGWRPPLDVLRQVSVWTPWISYRFFTGPKVDLSSTCKDDVFPTHDRTAGP
jgi:hypothetical protein